MLVQIADDPSSSLRVESKMIPDNDRLYRVHVNSWSETNGEVGYSSLSGVCDQCLIRHNIPVLRPSNKKWEFGQIQAYDASNEKHQVVFADETKEWVKVPRDPLSEYSHHFVNEEHSHPSFSLSTVSTFPTADDEEPELDQKHSSQSFENEKSIATIVSSNRTSYLASPEKKKLPEVYSPERFSSPVATKNYLDDVRGTIHLGTPNSQISALSGTTLPSTKSSILPSTKSPNSSSSKKSNTSRSRWSGISSKKTLRLWTVEEDRALLETIRANNNNLAWPKIASKIPGRTGKQCRERYLNHLKPSVKLTSWSVTEDATIFRLYHAEGSKWSRMVRFLPGRTDNSIKNRYHHLRRRFERRMESVGMSKAMMDLMKKIQESRLFRGAPVEPLLLKYLALRMLEGKGTQKSVMTAEYKFGPYHPVMVPTGCRRCGLIMPSFQTGRYMCRTTGWCQTCCGLSPVVTGDSLRIAHTIENGTK
ncbi:Myb-like DNA-binding protein [Nitzschia inconspicua]|uniref:Myb-like DNA-binding protein n=1 Tax=Nitzschia inconspicua TaxID=303405 RepID=A0A9K3LPG6_9STRA|nr:Myb-like DNA-binding protein [Nitzschia inconspicua]